MAKVFIGVDPHRLSATIEVVDRHERVLATGRFGTDKAGYAAMRRHVAGYRNECGRWRAATAPGARWPSGSWRMASTSWTYRRSSRRGRGCWTPGTTARPTPMTRTRWRWSRSAPRPAGARLRRGPGGAADAGRPPRRAVPGEGAVHQPAAPAAVGTGSGTGEEGPDRVAGQAILAAARPRDSVRKALKRLALEQLAELMVIEKKIKDSSKELKALVIARGSHLMDLTGVGPVVAARILADVGDVARFADRNRFASWTGTAPLDASSGEQIRHRLSRAGNRKANHVIHIAAVNQIRLDSPGRAYYRRKLAAGKTPMEALRCLKRRISDAIYRQLRADAPPSRTGGGPGRALRGGTHIQRGRLAPAHRHFGSATPGTRSSDATRIPTEAEDREGRSPPNRPLTSEGCRYDADAAAGVEIATGMAIRGEIMAM